MGSPSSLRRKPRRCLASSYCHSCLVIARLRTANMPMSRCVAFGLLWVLPVVATPEERKLKGYSIDSERTKHNGGASLKVARQRALPTNPKENRFQN